jgi:hypothetical protein
MTEVAHIEGVVKFDRAGGSSCLCCPGGNHIWRREIETDPFYLSDGRGATTVNYFLLGQLVKHPELEGKRVRVTLVALDE